jgi:ribosome-binding protein aMBF1 (putative translation factor)
MIMQRNRDASKSKIAELLRTLSPLRKKQLDARRAIADIIEKAMKTSGVSKIELAKRMDKQPSVISKWLSGTHNFTIDTIVEIEEDLHLNILRRKYEETIRDSMISRTALVNLDPAISSGFRVMMMSKRRTGETPVIIRKAKGYVSSKSAAALWNQ